MQPAIATGAVMKIAGVRKGRWRPGSVRRITSTAIDTAAKANSVPELEMFASCPTGRSEEHTSELQSLMRISYAVFCLKKKKTHLLIKLPDTQSLSLNFSHTYNDSITSINSLQHHIRLVLH